MENGKWIFTFIYLGYIEYTHGQTIVTEMYDSQCQVNGDDLILQCIGSPPGPSPIWYNPSGDAVSNGCLLNSGYGVTSLSCDPQCSVSPFPSSCNLTVALTPVPSIQGTWTCSFGGLTSPETVNVLDPVQNVTGQIDVESNGLATLTCISACVNPSVNITWYHENNIKITSKTDVTEMCSGQTANRTKSTVDLSWGCANSDITVQCIAYQESVCIENSSVIYTFDLQGNSCGLITTITEVFSSIGIVINIIVDVFIAATYCNEKAATIFFGFPRSGERSFPKTTVALVIVTTGITIVAVSLCGAVLAMCGTDCMVLLLALASTCLFLYAIGACEFAAAMYKNKESAGNCK